ncbi:acetylcholinesterase precursor [Karstenula rhodostoma CBS 690.94]|uniref:Carboxylic ester hydrolase n=1 Tax=Karstenula rhodostoma CBS 690.94 TaxID=1392251 RepID=A0A9P4P6N7_9PLEO|nr:acetylcholinesterase precursor [Karstenula rhodostoma CBS 690.94]
MMAVLSTVVALVAGFSAFARSQLIQSQETADVSNAENSLTLIYQNNLNASDDRNHVGALLLDPVSQTSAAAACASVNETLLPKSTLQKYHSDFAYALSYQDFAEYFDAANAFYTENGSANNGSYNAGLVDGSKIAVASGGNTFIGHRNQKSFQSLGIPYANNPQRWTYSSHSGSEDCLSLNIQTPYILKSGSKKSLRPVMFWIHGGGFTGGTGADPLTDGGNLASKEDLVVVSINYRLSTLGFLAIPGTDISGNLGIADQIVALDWVRANIASFGGNPKQITVIGGSAGAGSVRALLGSPKAIGKYQGAVAVSNLGGRVTLGLKGDYRTLYSTYYTINQSYAIAGSQIFSAAGCNDTDISIQIACLKQVDALKLVSLPTVARYVVQDGKFVNTPKLILATRNRIRSSTRNDSTAHVPVIFDVTRDDSLKVAPGINSTWAQRIIDSKLFPFYSTGNLTLDSFNVSRRVATDKTFRCIDQATVYAGISTYVFEKAYFYQMERTTGGYDPNKLGGPANNDPNNPYFRFHGADVPFVFGTLSKIREPADLYYTQLTTGYFASFAKTGNPNPDLDYLRVRGYDKVADSIRETGAWNEVTRKGKEVWLLDYPSRSGSFVDVDQCK